VASATGLRLRRPAWGLMAVVAVLAVGEIARHSVDVRRMRPEWYRGGEDRAFVEVARWAGAHTPPDTRFITPPWLEGWRCLSRRGTLVQYRDGSAMHWDLGFEAGWWERLGAVNCAVYYRESGLALELERRYLALTPAELASAAERFGIDGYVVMPTTWSHGQDLVAAYANAQYRAFAIDELRYAAEH